MGLCLCKSPETILGHSQVGLLAFDYLFFWNGVESLVCSLLSGAVDGVGVHLIDIGREVRPGDQSLACPPIPRDCGLKHHGQLLLEREMRKNVRNTPHMPEKKTQY